jgi:hypothetical protein
MHITRDVTVVPVVCTLSATKARSVGRRPLRGVCSISPAAPAKTALNVKNARRRGSARKEFSVP